MKLEHCNKIEVRESPIEGFGVFATEDIQAGTVLEVVPFILFPRHVNISKEMFNMLKGRSFISQKEEYLENLRVNLDFKEPEKYYFRWFPKTTLDNDCGFTVLPLGFGPIYNTSNTNNNADWKIDKKTFVFRATQDIKKDTEICTFYGYFLGDDGTTFNCETVFHFAIDMFQNNNGNIVHKIKSLRFGNLESFNSQRNNPSANQVHNLIMESSDGLTIKSVRLLQPNGQPFGPPFEPQPNISLTAIYTSLANMQRHQAPIVQFLFEFKNKTTGEQEMREVIWKK